jgi:hypothetical protein
MCTRQDVFSAAAFVEASSFEKGVLMEQNKRTKKLSWIEGRSGIMPTVGMINDRPICLSIFIDVIDGRNIVFYEPPSELVDYAMIEAFFEKNASKFCNNNADADRFWSLFQ